MTTNDLPSGFCVEALFPNYFAAGGVALTMSSILEGMRGNGISVGATVIAAERRGRPEFIRAVLDRRIYGVLERYISDPIDLVFLRSKRKLKTSDVAYFWLRNPPEMCQYLRENGVLVVREMINCTKARCRIELESAYRAFGSVGARITDEMVESERADLVASDYVFCPNPFVRESVLAAGVPAAKCLDASYGWSVDRLAGVSRLLPNNGEFTVAFVGTIDVRKGAPLLLEAWVKSRVRGRLILAGVLSVEVKEKFADVLNRPDVTLIGHVSDVGGVYRSADVFCLPTWEDGGPQVTIEAMSQGLAVVVTPMGTAGIFSADEDIGIVVPPGNIDALVEAIQRLAEDVEYRKRLQYGASLRAKEYTWEKVATRRANALRMVSKGAPSQIGDVK